MGKVRRRGRDSSSLSKKVEPSRLSIVYSAYDVCCPQGYHKRVTPLLKSLELTVRKVK